MQVLYHGRDRIGLLVYRRRQARVRALRERILAQLFVVLEKRQRIFQVRVSPFVGHSGILLPTEDGCPAPSRVLPCL